jgi:hypothetical protein
MFGIPSADAKVAGMVDAMLIAVGGSCIERLNKGSSYDSFVGFMLIISSILLISRSRS